MGSLAEILSILGTPDIRFTHRIHAAAQPRTAHAPVSGAARGDTDL
jgi:hypothetical protein